jgi:CBS domain-containing protein
MLAKDFISDVVMPLKTSDTGAKALLWMDDLKISHLPIVNNRAFLGLISESDIDNLTELNEPVGHMDLSLATTFVYEHQHVFDVLKLVYDSRLTLVPVVDQSENYLGCFTLEDLLRKLSKNTSILDPGGIIVLVVDHNSYDLSEISRIVEQNDAKILNLYVTTDPESMKMEVTLKINKTDVAPVMQTFTRFQYQIKAVFAAKDDLNDLKDRYDALMNYLSI